MLFSNFIVIFVIFYHCSIIVPSIDSVILCPSDVFGCQNGYQYILNISHCNCWYDCSDYSDEQNCGSYDGTKWKQFEKTYVNVSDFIAAGFHLQCKSRNEDGFILVNQGVWKRLANPIFTKTIDKPLAKSCSIKIGVGTFGEDRKATTHVVLKLGSWSKLWQVTFSTQDTFHVGHQRAGSTFQISARRSIIREYSSPISLDDLYQFNVYHLDFIDCNPLSIELGCPFNTTRCSWVASNRFDSWLGPIWFHWSSPLSGGHIINIKKQMAEIRSPILLAYTGYCVSFEYFITYTMSFLIVSKINYGHVQSEEFIWSSAVSTRGQGARKVRFFIYERDDYDIGFLSSASSGMVMVRNVSIEPQCKVSCIQVC